MQAHVEYGRRDRTRAESVKVLPSAHKAACAMVRQGCMGVGQGSLQFAAWRSEVQKGPEIQLSTYKSGVSG